MNLADNLLAKFFNTEKKEEDKGGDDTKKSVTNKSRERMDQYVIFRLVRRIKMRSSRCRKQQLTPEEQSPSSMFLSDSCSSLTQSPHNYPSSDANRQPPASKYTGCKKGQSNSFIIDRTNIYLSHPMNTCRKLLNRCLLGSKDEWKE